MVCGAVSRDKTDLRTGLAWRTRPTLDAYQDVAALPAESPRSNARTSDSRNLRCPPGVLMLLMRPDAAHRVTVFGSTRKRAATSPGVSRRSLLPSTFHPSCLRFGACLQCRENIRLLPRFPENKVPALVGSLPWQAPLWPAWALHERVPSRRQSRPDPESTGGRC